MSKSTRFTQEQLDKLGLVETSPGVFGPKKKERRGDFKWKGDNKEEVSFEDNPDGAFKVITPEAFDGIKCDRIELYEQVQWPKPKVKTEVDKAVELADEINIATAKLQHMLDCKDDKTYSISITVPGDPTPQQRHRHHQVKGADFVSTYDPSSKKKKEFLKQCLPFKPDKPYEQPLRVDMVFYFSRPKSHYRTGKYAHILKDTAPMYHTSRNDADNCAKFVMDALNKVFWKDDALVSYLSVIKKYDDNPRTEITITPL